MYETLVSPLECNLPITYPHYVIMQVLHGCLNNFSWFVGRSIIIICLYHLEKFFACLSMLQSVIWCFMIWLVYLLLHQYVLYDCWTDWVMPKGGGGYAFHMVFQERWSFLPWAHHILPRAALAERAGFGDEWEKTHLSWKTMWNAFCPMQPNPDLNTPWRRFFAYTCW